MEDKLRDIKKLLLGLAEYYRHTISSKELLHAYAEDLEDLELEVIANAIKRTRKEYKFFPLPAVIREYALGSSKDEAQDVATKIVEAMHKYGWNNYASARSFIGELGWLVVQRDGGWENLCKSIQNYDELGIRKAQWRELASSFSRREVLKENKKLFEIENKSDVSALNNFASNLVKAIPSV